jgi:GTP pyrophosphokinase
VSWNSSDRNGSRPNTYAVNIQIEALDRAEFFKMMYCRILKDNKVNVRSAQVKLIPVCPH